MSLLSAELQQIISQAAAVEAPSEAQRQRMKQQLMLRVAAGSALVAVAERNLHPELGCEQAVHDAAATAANPSRPHPLGEDTLNQAAREATAAGENGVALSAAKYTLIMAILGGAGALHLGEAEPPIRLRAQLAGLTTAPTEASVRKHKTAKTTQRNDKTQRTAAHSPRHNDKTQRAAALTGRARRASADTAVVPLPRAPATSDKPSERPSAAPDDAPSYPDKEVSQPSPPASRLTAPSSGSATPPERQAESYYIRQARLLAETDPDAAARWLEQHRRHYPRGALARVRRALRAKLMRMQAEQEPESP